MLSLESHQLLPPITFIRSVSWATITYMVLYFSDVASIKYHPIVPICRYLEYDVYHAFADKVCFITPDVTQFIKLYDQSIYDRCAGSGGGAGMRTLASQISARVGRVRVNTV